MIPSASQLNLNAVSVPQGLPNAFVLEMDLEDVELVERPAAFPLLQV